MQQLLRGAAMTPAEKRIKDLIDRWLISLDLHLQYADLNDSAYNRVQPWPVHDRPTRWVLELAKQKTLELKTVVDARLGMGDAKVADALELMMFLANMVGSQHVQRFIPMADPERHAQALLTEPALQKQAAATKPVAIPNAPSKPIIAPTNQASSQPTSPAANPSTSSSTSATASSLAPTISITAIERTVEMPRLPPRETTVPAQTTAAAKVETPVPNKAHPAGVDNEATREMPRPQRLPHAPARNVKPTPAKAEPSKPLPAAKGALPDSHRLVVSDAVRLINWGKDWHELAESIARMADRPKLPEIRKILRMHRSDIETRAAAEAPEKKPDKPTKRS